MTDSCDTCISKCCIRPGAPPTTKVSLDRFINGPANMGDYCEHYALDTEKCMIWGTPEFPKNCRTYICHFRHFTDNERKTIASVVYDGTPCHGCGVKWYLKTSDTGRLCEICGKKWQINEPST
jgi:hypothetical protein